MNKARRKTLESLLTTIETAKDALNAAAEELTSVKDEEQEAFDNLSDGLKQSEQGQATMESAGHLANACSFLDTVEDTLDSVLAGIEEALG